MSNLGRGMSLLGLDLWCQTALLGGGFHISPSWSEAERRRRTVGAQITTRQLRCEEIQFSGRAGLLLAAGRRKG